MPKFSVKDLLVSTTLSLGFGAIWTAFHIPKGWEHLPVFLASMIWLGSGFCLGGGIGVLFKHPWEGALVGFVLQIVGLLFLLGMYVT